MKKKSIKKTLIGLSVIPAILVSIALIGISVHSMWTGMTEEVSKSLEIAASSLYNTYSLVSPGDYEIIDGSLVKGGVMIENDFTIVDELKKFEK